MAVERYGYLTIPTQDSVILIRVWPNEAARTLAILLQEMGGSSFTGGQLAVAEAYRDAHPEEFRP